MTEILFIKTSSMGDVLHHLPAVTDARRHFPQARLSWVVEETYAPLVALHPAVDEIIPIAVRRWKRQIQNVFLRPLSEPAGAPWLEISATMKKLRARRYDAVIDTQGLFRTGILAKLMHGTRHGYDKASIRESFAARFYDVRHTVSRALHAIERNRLLTGRALGYEPEGPIDYGLDHSRLAPAQNTPYAVLLHATARREKEWPEERLIEVAAKLSKRGLEIVLPWGSGEERERSERIAAALPRARIPERQPLDALARIIAGAAVVVGVDTGLLHLAAALGVPLVAVFVGSAPGLTGPRGSGRIEILGAKGAPPTAAAVIAAIERIA
jgi:heptosyltransferase-1